MSEFNLEWEFQNRNNVKGRIDLSQIFKEFSFKFTNSVLIVIKQIKFEIAAEYIKINNLGYISVDYKIKNNTDKNFKDLKIYIYLYQIIDENMIYNNFLKDDIFYEGSLYDIIKLDGNESYNMNIKIFPLDNEEVSTTLLVIDSQSHIIYMSPTSKSFYLNNFK